MIFDIFSIKAWMTGIGVAAVVAAGSYTWGRIDGGAKVRAKWDAEKGAQIAAAAVASAERGRTQARWSDNAIDAANQRKTDDQTLVSLRARVAAAERRLRDAAGTGGGGMPEAAPDACGQAVADARRDLAQCGSRLAELGADAEERVAELRELTATWPVQD